MSANQQSEFNSLNISQVISKIENNQPFSMIKLCHGFWELNVIINRKIQKHKINNTYDENTLSAILTEIATNWPADLFQETKALLKKSNQFPRLLNLASELGWRNGRAIEGTPLQGLNETKDIIKNSFHKDTPIFDGLFWKNAIIDGNFIEFIECIREKNVLIVGPEYIKNFAAFAGLTDSHFIEVHPTKAAWKRHDILDELISIINTLECDNFVCLMEAGGVTSAWLIFQLYQRFEHGFFFALGQALNICNYSKLDKTNWFEVYRKEICTTITKINDQWPHKAHLFQPLNNDWESIRKGYDNELTELLDQAIDNTCEPKTSFIENKIIDHELYAKILSISQKSNHWSNFGPVSQLLEQTIEQMLAIKPDKAVVMCKSATHAIHTLVHLKEMQAKKSLRWVVSSFGFFSTVTGPLANAKIIDCDEKAILSIEHLQALDIDSWDGLIITNTFGLCDDFSRYIDFCETHDKVIFIDNAAAFFTKSRTTDKYPDEVISFHQTKPWGIGEGGCAIIDKKDKEKFYALTNFGVNLDKKHRAHANNGKISDHACASILQRLINMPNWHRKYQLQMRRIHSIAKKCGLIPLTNKRASELDVMSSLPFLSRHKISKDQLQNDHIVLRKYYQPLCNQATVANTIFSKIINIPCHPEIADIDELLIEEALLKAQDNNN